MSYLCKPHIDEQDAAHVCMHGHMHAHTLVPYLYINMLLDIICVC